MAYLNNSAKRQGFTGLGNEYNYNQFSVTDAFFCI